MKKYISLFCLLLCCSCGDFLDENPKDQIPEEKAYSDASSLYLNTVATLYNYFGGYSQSQGLQGTYRGVYDLNTFTTDEAIIPTRGGDWYDGGFWQALFLHSWTSTNDALLDTWNYLYKVIALCNRSIEKLDEHSTLLSASQLETYKAEVRAIRAMYYYYLLDLYGRVPLVLYPATPMRDVSQSPRSEVFRFCVDELQWAAPLLSAERSNTFGDYYGRVTRPVVYFLLAKLALNAEVYADDDWTDGERPDGKNILFTVDGTEMNAWQACETYCEKIKSLGYSLAERFEDNFSVHNETSVENILTIPMDPSAYTNQMQNLFRSYHYRHASAYGFTAENGSSATLETLAAFGYETDSVDLRFDKTFYAGIVTDLDSNVVTLQNGDTLCYYPDDIRLVLTGDVHQATAGARMKKYEVDKTATKDGKLMNNDIVLFRFADVLLMESEAKVRNGKDGSEELNQVRRRAGMEPCEATLSSIYRERRLELTWEGWHRQDMVRYGMFTSAYSSRPQLSGEDSGYTTVFPIPYDIVHQNDNITQNPGYK